MKHFALALTLSPLLAGVAHAQPTDGPIGGADFSNNNISDDRRRDFRSPQNWNLELRFGPYRPDIDSEFPAPPPLPQGCPGAPNCPPGDQRPYTKLFGPGSEFLFITEVDYELFHRFGTLAIGGQLGYFTSTASALARDTMMPSTGDQTSFSMLPLALLAIYRFDLPLRLHIPLVPYAKFGLAYDIWWIKNGNGDVTTKPIDCTKGICDRAMGSSAGTVLAGGISLLLDWLDPEAAVEADTELGINHTYFFFEYYRASVNGFGDHGLHVGDSTWAAGLAFEF